MTGLPRARRPLCALALLALLAWAGSPWAAPAPVPDFSLSLLDGGTTSLAAHRGKPVLMNFFHSK